MYFDQAGGCLASVLLNRQFMEIVKCFRVSCEATSNVIFVT